MQDRPEAAELGRKNTLQNKAVKGLQHGAVSRMSLRLSVNLHWWCEEKARR